LARVGERVRRVALGLTVALVTARAYKWSEPDLNSGAGGGLVWILALLVVAGLAIAAGLIGGRFRFRWSWADLAVVALTVLVAFSSLHALDRRPAINLAWEWIALGVAYLLLRNLPRTRGESSVLAGALVATAFAVSVYGLYQAGIELPALRAQFARNPGPMLAQQGIAPNTPAAAQFADRLMGSNELLSTFALANSLAGFIVGPLVLALGVWLQNLEDREKGAPRWPALLLAAPVVLVLLVCLILTKSRSAYIGLLVGVAILVWQSRRRVSGRMLIVACGWGLAIVALLVAAGLATGRLDREVLTQSSMSMRYRWEYWQATWSAMTGGSGDVRGAWKSPMFWRGAGPGNFREAYLRYKLPQSSEEILDPHNLFLEVWATAGFWAFLALSLALVMGLRELLGPPAAVGKRPPPAPSEPPDLAENPRDRDGEDGPPRQLRWLALSAGAGWILVVALGMMNLFESDLFPRWLVLGGGWLAAAPLGAPLWRRLPIPAMAMGAAVAAVVITLLAAGGIGIPTVALGLWSTLAIGLNLREDRSCGRLREHVSRIPPFVLSTVWAAVFGLFLGAVIPFWRSEAAIAEAEDAMRRQPPDFNRAKSYFERAIAVDRYYVRPWLGYADMALQAWLWGGGHASDLRWKTIPDLYESAVSPPRNPMAWTLRVRRADVIRQLLRSVGPELKPVDDIRYRGEIVKELRIASQLYPSNARLHARLAESSAEISMAGDAVTEAEEALRLDNLNPHLDKKLATAERERLEAILAEAKRSAKP
jgi:O-antigen ligase